MNDENLNNTAEMFKALAHPVRLKIVMGLMHKENCNVSTMVEKLGISQPNVSQHLNILKHAGVIENFRKGGFVCYKLSNDYVKEIIKLLEGKECSG